MKANFDISLPSIPGKCIKFKIQDIKSAAFGVQKARFPDDKSNLVKKFVDSFHNFHQPEQNDETATQAQTQLSRSYVTQKRQTRFRSMIPQNKKFLLPIYNQLKKKKKEQIMSIQQPKTKGGYTFNKFQNRGINPQQKQTNRQDNINLTDNYYFTQDQISYQPEQQEPVKQKKPKPSAVFKNQTRKRVYQRLDHSAFPGPGSYLKDKAKSKSQSKTKKTNKPTSDKQMDYNHLKQIITKVIAEQPQQQEQIEITTKEKKNDHMFILDDRDRFGDQLFPIAPKLNVPGPGSYSIHDTMQDKMKKIVVVEEQRKLLKQWFNS